MTSKTIDSGATPDAWEHLYKWVENQTLLFESTHEDNDRNPWLMPDKSRKEIIEHLHRLDVGLGI